jgi:hypothetical protein
MREAGRTIAAMRPDSRQRRILALAAALSIMAAAPAADAAKKKQTSTRASSEAVFRCKDDRGQSHFGQSIPAECLERDVEVLDGTGRVVRVIPGRRAMERVAAQQATEEALKAAAQRDRTLLATYLSVADIERLRDQRLELLEQQSLITNQYIVNLREREARLMADVRRYRPYSDKPKAAPLPDHVAEDIVNTVNGLQVYEQELAKNTEERERLRAEFESDIARYKQLQGIN